MSQAARPKKKTKKSVDSESRALSYVMAVFFVLLGIGLIVGYNYLERGPSKLFNLLAAGGVGSLLSGIGLIIQPLDSERLSKFQNEGNPIAVFNVMPVFWKIWMIVILAAMIGGFFYVSQTTVRVGAR
jgi:hypothetical protein